MAKLLQMKERRVMNLIKFAIINLQRSKKVNITIGLLMIFGITALIFSYGFIKMTFYGLGEQMIHQSIGHFQIQHPKEKEDEGEYPLEFGIKSDDLSNIKKILSKYEDNIEALMPKLEFSGIISFEDKSTIFMANGVDSENESVFASVFVTIKDGENLGLDFDNPKKDEVIIGVKLAKYLSVKAGDTITIMVNASDSSLNAIDAVVSGIFSTGIEQIDKRLIMTPLFLAKELMKTDKISKLSVGLYDTYLSKKISNEIKNELKNSDYNVYYWKELAPFYKKVVSLYTTFFIFLGGIIIFIVLSTVFGSVSNMVISKTKEMGMLKANGFTNQNIISLVLLEVFLLSAIAAIIGFIISHIGMEIINGLGFSMPPPPGSDKEYPLAFNHIWLESIFISISLILISLTASLKPSIDAGKLKIADALRS